MFCLIGPWGINHGVELHGEIVKYAYEHLETFKKESPALDFFSFCEPQFVQGNALQVLINSLKTKIFHFSKFFIVFKTIE